MFHKPHDSQKISKRLTQPRRLNCMFFVVFIIPTMFSVLIFMIIICDYWSCSLPGTTRDCIVSFKWTSAEGKGLYRSVENESIALETYDEWELVHIRCTMYKICEGRAINFWRSCSDIWFFFLILSPLCFSVCQTNSDFSWFAFARWRWRRSESGAPKHVDEVSICERATRRSPKTITLSFSFFPHTIFYPWNVHVSNFSARFLRSHVWWQSFIPITMSGNINGVAHISKWLIGRKIEKTWIQKLSNE